MPPVEVAVLTLPGPWGPYLVAATERGVVAAGWSTTEEGLLQDLRRRLGPVELVDDGPAADVLSTVRPILEAIVAGHPSDTASLPIDLDDRPRFDQAVLGAVRSIGWGETASYGAIARQVGAPRASRAVGGALGRNPISLVIPCHRVIASDGTLGGYGGDGWVDRDRELSRKEALLRREGVTVERRPERERRTRR
jgi:methylated-DNA-[protein]-cysteine S-methyltransferase